MKLKRDNRQARSAFTLIEIMVATVVMLILVGLVVQITSSVLNVWNRASGKLAANAEARIAMDFLTQDLQTAVFRNNGQQWLRVEGPEDIDGLYDSQTVALKLFSPALDRDASSAGDICAIAYRLEYQSSFTGGSNVYALYRSIARPDFTFTTLLGSSSDPNSPQLVLDEDPVFWNTSTIINTENYLVSNIVDFKILIYLNDGSNLPMNANAKSVLDLDYVFGGTDATLKGGIQEELLYAEIILTVVSDDGLELLRLLDEGGSGTGYSSPDDVVREHGEQFNRRVYFPSQSF
jgi:prepilin-type N-terminal cleavage/methylation domain-containing protein